MKRFHIALSSNNIGQSVRDYSARLQTEPVVVVEGEYALFRTETLNVSIRNDTEAAPGSLRHLGWEDPAADSFSTETDCNGILWEHFTPDQQDQEILELWPEAKFKNL